MCILQQRPRLLLKKIFCYPIWLYQWGVDVRQGSKPMQMPDSWEYQRSQYFQNWQRLFSCYFAFNQSPYHMKTFHQTAQSMMYVFYSIWKIFFKYAIPFLGQIFSNIEKVKVFIFFVSGLHCLSVIRGIPNTRDIDPVLTLYMQSLV